MKSPIFTTSTKEDPVNARTPDAARQRRSQTEGLADEPPLFVSLDGALIRTNVFFENLAAAFRAHPLRAMAALFSFLRGFAAVKKSMAKLGPVGPEQLPFRNNLRRWLVDQHAHGRQIVLATSADMSVAQAVADELGVFSSIQASDGVINNRGSRKLASILAYTQQQMFDYCGSASADLPIFAEARQAIVVGPGRSVAVAAAREGNADLRFVGRTEHKQVAILGTGDSTVPLAQEFVGDGAFLHDVSGHGNECSIQCLVGRDCDVPSGFGGLSDQRSSRHAGGSCAPAQANSSVRFWQIDGC